MTSLGSSETPFGCLARAAQLDVLVVGAGPTGLTLASQLARFGVRFRIIDKAHDRAGESRALTVHARSLEVLQTLGLGEMLASRGRTTTRLMLHVDRREPPAIELGNIGRDDTRFPFILFVSQPETEAVLTTHLESCGVVIERGVELEEIHQQSDDVGCTLRHADGRRESVHARYLAGCDGAHSTVRKQAGIPFEGGAYPQEFALGDVEADGLELGAIHAFGAGRGFAMFFPLGHPRTWRVMAMEAGRQRAIDNGSDVTTNHLSLVELQSMVAEPTYGSVTLRDAAWLTRFRLHHRQATQYRDTRVFLAGDAAHIHSPVGGQGMNTGIQDAWNLGWKLAMVARGHAIEPLLDSYHAERWPVGRTLLRATDRLFARFAKSVSGGQLMMSVRRLVVRGVVAPALSRRSIRAAAFHFVSQLGIHYHNSPAVAEGEPKLSKGPQAGDRLPDAKVLRDGRPSYLQQVLDSPRVHLLLCGPVAAWNRDDVMTLAQRFPDVLAINYLAREHSDGALVDSSGEAFTRLGVHRHAMYLIRPDGHVAFRSGGTDLQGPAAYLAKWFSAGRTPARPVLQQTVRSHQG
jgi:2-polyprenyl-6-methoxyphenol hydroxylase-like FAD-dependent oxidoreductase